jgi:hypothetical protein
MAGVLNRAGASWDPRLLDSLHDRTLIQPRRWEHRVGGVAGRGGWPGWAARCGFLSEDGADAERLDTLTGFLRQELLQLDVEDVTALPAETPPSGSRAFDVVAVGGLLVALGRSAEGLRAVVLAVRKWLSRGEGMRRTVRLEVGGDVLELSEATAADQQRLVDLFISRHTVGDGA